MMQKMRDEIVRLGFEAESIRAYQACRNAELVAVSQCFEGPFNKVANHFAITGRYSGNDAMLPDLDAITTTTRSAGHSDSTVAALNASKDVAWTAPMATMAKNCNRVEATQVALGKRGPLAQTSTTSCVIGVRQVRRCDCVLEKWSQSVKTSRELQGRSSNSRACGRVSKEHQRCGDPSCDRL